MKDIEDSILEFSALDVKVMFTELDLTALPNPWDLKGAEVSQNFAESPKMNPYPNGLPDSMQVKLAKGFEKVIFIFAIVGVIYLIITFLTTHERIVSANSDKTPISQDLKDLSNNKPWIIMLILTILVFITLALKGRMYIYYFKYYLNENT